MKKQIEKLALQPKQYFAFGCVMMIMCLAFCTVAFLLSDYSFVFAAAILVLAIENGIVGYGFLTVFQEMKSKEYCEDVLTSDSAQRSVRNTVFLSVFLTLMIVVCTASILVFTCFDTDSQLVTGNTSVKVITIEQYTITKIITTVDVEGLPPVVYAAPTGEKYHYSAVCAGRHSFAITIEEALANSLTPCHVCAYQK